MYRDYSSLAGEAEAAETTARPGDGTERWRSAGALHDLGNLVQVASSALNRAAGAPDMAAAPNVEPLVSAARDALAHVATLVRSMAEGTAGGRGRAELADVDACLVEVAGLVAATSEAAIHVDLSIDGELPPARCDRTGLRSALLNLLINAREAMPGGGRISVGASATTSGAGSWIVVTVTDEGIGMTKETAGRAFEPFFTTKSRGLGGVGLPMVRDFIELHGGSIAMESIVGAGTTIMLRLPAANWRL